MDAERHRGGQRRRGHAVLDHVGPYLLAVRDGGRLVRGELDGNAPLAAFADKLEKAVLDTIEGGTMTGDLAALCAGEDVQKAGTEGFLRAIRKKLEA